MKVAAAGLFALMAITPAMAGPTPAYIRRNYPISIQPLLLHEEALNDKCRGDPNSLDNGVCGQRDKAVKQLQVNGWCWGPDNASDEAHRRWMRCGPNATPGY